ncbi:hypothetical protein CWS43_25940 [Rahnella sp. AA]|uniref:hypothetical protein n=1 Tax=Rahnella sp. AA TaxID=2057180 RepID=UPI000C324EDB|nr:hypothetical protein [Rahnella sp. AA]PKE27569.1 hypothetical protein CWS43_25940 [Rahnella sp. AA]
MSNEIVDETALIAALKETQQAVSQLQKPLESLALTQLVGLTYNKKEIAGHMDTWKKLLKEEGEKSAELNALEQSEAEKAANYTVILDKGANSSKCESLKDSLVSIRNEKIIFEGKYPLIAKLAKRIDAIE